MTMVQKTKKTINIKPLSYYLKIRKKEFNKVRAYTYFIKRKRDNKKYHGVCWGNTKINQSPNDTFGKTYFSSGDFKKEFQRYSDRFIFKLCWTFKSIEDARYYETLVNRKIYKRKDWANKQAYPAIINSRSVIKRLAREHSERLKGIPFSEEHKKKISKGLKGKQKSFEHRKRLSEIWKKIERSENWNKNISKALKGRKLTKKWKLKIGQGNLGKTYSLETRKKMSINAKKIMKGSGNPMYGEKHSLKTRKKMSINAKKRMKGSGNPMYGRTHTKKVRKILSEVNIGKEPWNKGISHSKRTKLKLKEAWKRRRKNKKDIPWNKGKKYSLKKMFLMKKKRKREKKLKSFVQSFLPNTKGGKYENSNAYNNSAT